MNWDDLQTFRAVAEELSFTRAARKLRVSVPVVSQRIARFEKRLGVALVRRNTREVALTDQGLLVFGTANRMIAQWDRLAAVLTAQDQPADREVIRLGAGEVSAAGFVSTMRRTLPQYRLSFSLSDTTTTMSQLESGQLDAVFGYQYTGRPLPVPNRAHLRTVVREPLYVALPRGHRLAAGGGVDLTGLRDERWAVGQSSGAADDWEVELLAAAGVTDFLRTSQSSAIRLVAAGEAVTLCSPVTHITDGDEVALARVTSPSVAMHVVFAWDPAKLDNATADLLYHTGCDHHAGQVRRVPALWREVSAFPAQVPGITRPGLLAPKGLGAAMSAQPHSRQHEANH